MSVNSDGSCGTRGSSSVATSPWTRCHRTAASVTFGPLNVKYVIVATHPPPDAEQSTRHRILAATFVVLSRDGRRKLQLSDVAAEAKVSRPTLYRYFGSKEGLLEAFGLYEQDNFDSGIASAMAGLSGPGRLDAALRFVVAFQSNYSLGSLAEIEPEHVLHQLKRVLPIMQERIARIIPGENSDIAAAAVVRIALCHYIIAEGSPAQFLAELRHAAGLGSPRRRLHGAAAG
jgi:AcrR family transcriptional regulator